MGCGVCVWRNEIESDQNRRDRSREKERRLWARDDRGGEKEIGKQAGERGRETR